MVWGSGFELIAKEGHSALAAKFQERLTSILAGKYEPSIPLSIIAYSMAGALLILLKWWLESKKPYSPERMDEIFQQLFMPSFRNALVVNDTMEKRVINMIIL